MSEDRDLTLSRGEYVTDYLSHDYGGKYGSALLSQAKSLVRNGSAHCTVDSPYVSIYQMDDSKVVVTAKRRGNPSSLLVSISGKKRKVTALEKTSFRHFLN